MSRELQDRADIIEKELKEMLVPISNEIRRGKTLDNNKQSVNSNHWSI